MPGPRIRSDQAAGGDGQAVGDQHAHHGRSRPLQAGDRRPGRALRVGHAGPRRARLPAQASSQVRTNSTWPIGWPVASAIRSAGAPSSASAQTRPNRLARSLDADARRPVGLRTDRRRPGPTGPARRSATATPRPDPHPRPAPTVRMARSRAHRLAPPLARPPEPLDRHRLGRAATQPPGPARLSSTRCAGGRHRHRIVPRRITRTRRTTVVVGQRAGPGRPRRRRQVTCRRSHAVRSVALGPRRLVDRLAARTRRHRIGQQPGRSMRVRDRGRAVVVVMVPVAVLVSRAPGSPAFGGATGEAPAAAWAAWAAVDLAERDALLGGDAGAVVVFGAERRRPVAEPAELAPDRPEFGRRPRRPCGGACAGRPGSGGRPGWSSRGRGSPPSRPIFASSQRTEIITPGRFFFM